MVLLFGARPDPLPAGLRAAGPAGSAGHEEDTAGGAGPGLGEVGGRPPGAIQHLEKLPYEGRFVRIDLQNRTVVGPLPLLDFRCAWILTTLSLRCGGVSGSRRSQLRRCWSSAFIIAERKRRNRVKRDTREKRSVTLQLSVHCQLD